MFLTVKPTFALDLLSAINVQQSSSASAVMCKSESLKSKESESQKMLMILRKSEYIDDTIED